MHILNPGSPLPLTLTNCSRDVVERFKNLLDRNEDRREAYDEMVLLFSENNIICQELDHYVSEARKSIKEYVKRKINEYAEWTDSSDKDKEDILGELRRKGILELDTIPSTTYSFEELLFCEAETYLDNADLYAAFKDNAKLYNFYISSGLRQGDQIQTVSPDNYGRHEWETLVDMGFALRGKDIPIEKYLTRMRMKDINEYYSNKLTKKFNRKADAIKFAAVQPDVFEFISQVVSLRQSFYAINPLEIDVDRVIAGYRKVKAQLSLIEDTYRTGKRTMDSVNRSGGSVVDTNDSYWIVQSEYCCAHCAAENNKKYEELPTRLPPYHIGCTCSIDLYWREVEDDEVVDLVNCYFRGTAELDISNLGEQARQMSKSVLAQLSNIDNTDVAVTLTIHAHNPDGFDDNTAASVKKLCQSLDYDMSEFWAD